MNHSSDLGVRGLVVAELVAGLVGPGSSGIAAVVLHRRQVLHSVRPAGILAWENSKTVHENVK